MKLAVLPFVAVLGLGLARVADAQPADPYSPPPPPALRPPPLRAPLRAAIMARFDHDRDGRLDRRERRQAIRALRQLVHHMERADRRARIGRARERALLRRFDRNGDGRVGPDEMPPGLANRLRHLDRDHDGWLDDDELGGR